MSDLLPYEGSLEPGGAISSDDAEMFTLGSAMLIDDPSAYLAKLEPEDFYRPANRHVLRSMKDLVADRQPIDPATLGEDLRRKGLLEAVGGQAYVNELDLSVPSVVNREAYAGTVLDTWARRSILSHLAELERSVRQFRPLAEIWQAAQGIGSLIARARPPRKERTWKDLVQAQNRDSRLGGVPTGNGALDDLLEFGGFTNGQITLVMAGSGEGKTTWGLGAVFATCDRGERCAILTFADNDEHDILRRALRYKCGIPDLKSAEAQARILSEGGYPDSAESLMRRFRDAQDAVYAWDLELYDVAADDEDGTYELARAWLLRKVDEGLARPEPKPMSLALWDYAQEINVGSPELLRLSFYQQQAWVARNMARLCKTGRTSGSASEGGAGRRTRGPATTTTTTAGASCRSGSREGWPCERAPRHGGPGGSGARRARSQSLVASPASKAFEIGSPTWDGRCRSECCDRAATSRR